MYILINQKFDYFDYLINRKFNYSIIWRLIEFNKNCKIIVGEKNNRNNRTALPVPAPNFLMITLYCILQRSHFIVHYYCPSLLIIIVVCFTRWHLKYPPSVVSNNIDYILL
jgi:hypothetical protein